MTTEATEAAAPCLDCGGKGWSLYNEGEANEEIERCDTCKRYPTDEDAQAAALAAAPCLAEMGCLCAGHARGNAPDAPCDTSEDDPVTLAEEEAFNRWKCPNCGGLDTVQVSVPAWFIEGKNGTLELCEPDSEADVTAWYCEKCETSGNGAPIDLTDNLRDDS